MQPLPGRTGPSTTLRSARDDGRVKVSAYEWRAPSGTRLIEKFTSSERSEGPLGASTGTSLAIAMRSLAALRMTEWVWDIACMSRRSEAEPR